MAYDNRDFGWEYGRWGRVNRPEWGGMRSGGWGSAGWGNTGWGNGGRRDFADEEGWYGAGYEGMPGGGFYDRGDWQPRGGRSGWGRGFRGGYDTDLSNRGGGGSRGWGWESGYPGRESGYEEGWHGSRRGRQQNRASDIMTEDPEAVTPDAKLSEVAQKMRDLDVGIIPVVDSSSGRRLRGVITDRDIAIRAVAEGRDGSSRVGDVMTEHVRSVNKNDSIQDVMRVMRREQVRRVPVTDREGRLVGIIAQADLAIHYGTDPASEMEVEETIERISEPARSEDLGVRMAASGRSRRSSKRSTRSRPSNRGSTRSSRNTARNSRNTETETGGEQGENR